MKKIIALILSVVMICCMFAACSKDDPSGTVTPLPTTEATEPEASTPETTEPEASEPEATQPEATEPATQPTETKDPEETKAEASLGRAQGGVYTNDYLGITCTLDENWTFATAEELQEIPGEVADALKDSAIADKLGGQIVDMQAENATNLSAINIVYQKMDLNTQLTYAKLTEDQVIDLMLGQKDVLTSSYESAGMTVISMEKEHITFCGKDRAVLKTVTSMQGITCYMVQLMDCKLGEYMVTTTIVCYQESDLTDTLALFSAI